MGAADVWLRADHEGDVCSMDLKAHLPAVGFGRRCPAFDANAGGYCSLMSDEEYEELIADQKFTGREELPCELHGSGRGVVLMPRLVRDELWLIHQVVSAS